MAQSYCGNERAAVYEKIRVFANHMLPTSHTVRCVKHQKQKLSLPLSLALPSASMNRILILLLALLSLSPAFAWNHTGHKVVAELTWRNLSSGKRKAAGELLKQHPHYALLLATNVPAGADINEWA